MHLSSPTQSLRRAGWIALLLLQVAGFVRFLAGFHYVPGADAYYYALQAQSLLDSGHLKVPDGDVVHYLVAAVARCRFPVEPAFKIVLTLIFAAYGVGFLLLLVRLKEKVQPLVALLWTLSSTVISFHVIEFPKLSLGLATVPFCLWLLLLPGAGKRWVLWLALLLAAACFIHPVTAVLAVIFACAVILERSLGTGVSRSLRGKTLRAASFVCILLALALAGRFFALGPRLASLLQPAPPAIFTLVKAPDIPYEMKLAVLGFWILSALLLVVYLRSKLVKKLDLILIMSATLALPLWPDHEPGFQGLGARLAALFIFVALPLIAILCDELAANMSFARVPTPWLQRVAALLTFAALATLPLRLEGYRDQLMIDDYAQYEKVVAALSRCEIPMLIAHRGLDFFYTYRLRRDAFHFEPEAGWNRSQIWRVAARITPEEVAYYSPPSCPWGESARPIPGTDYLLVREDCWEQLRAAIHANDNPDLYIEVWQDPENPSQPRPVFLRARRRTPAEE